MNSELTLTEKEQIRFDLLHLAIKNIKKQTS
jgi:hypothetical protein